MSSFLVLWLVGATPAGESLAQVQARELAAALEEVKRDPDGGCVRLEEALTYFWAPWSADERVQWPRVWRTPIPESLAAWKPAADACAAELAADEWGLSNLIHSGLLRSEELHARSLALALERKVVAVSEDGGVEYSPPQSLSRSLERAHDPATAPVTRLTGKFDPELARKVIRQNRNVVMWCYQRSADPHLSGELWVRFTLVPGRDTASVALEKTTVGNSRVEACVLTRAARWHWPRPKKGEVVFTFPYQFEPGRDAE
ncbi:MAG: AgmX/PglI C-terminal domain-containing protein [Archangium sp.]|nr:AgmX/PglI C-terminal domain-containing protein [Archangium sp.]